MTKMPTITISIQHWNKVCNHSHKGKKGGGGLGKREKGEEERCRGGESKKVKRIVGIGKKLLKLAS